MCSLSLFLFLLGCGGGKRPPPPVMTGGVGLPSSPLPDRTPSRVDQAPGIRVLLKASFRSVAVEGSDFPSLQRIQAEGGQITLRDESGRALRTGSGFRLNPRRGSVLRLDGVPYQGALEVFVNPLGTPVIVNELSLETYLQGVIPNELSSAAGAQLEAIKALTIAARSFASYSLGQNARRGFDVYSDNRSQVYRGTSSEQPLSNQAIQQTRGTIATYQNKPIVAFYSSTCGGLTEDYQAAFQGAHIPYLEGGAACPDSASPSSTWEEHIEVSRIQRNLDRLAGVGRLRGLVSLRKGQWGRTVEMRFVGDQGEKVLKGLDIRSALGLKSSWILALEPRRDRSGYIVETHARGRGWGHGVGLCQMGTVELARQGWGFERILKHYYKGIDLTRRW